MPDPAEVPAGGTPPAGSAGTDREPALASPAGAATSWTAPDQEPPPRWLGHTASGLTGTDLPLDPITGRPAEPGTTRRRGLRVSLTAIGLVVAIGLAGATATLLQPNRTRVAGSAVRPEPAAGSGQHASGPASTARSALLGLLAARSAAVLAKDRNAYLATVDPQARLFRSHQARAFDSLTGLPLRSWEYSVTVTDPFELSDARRVALGPTAWTVEVALRYQIEGYDEAQSKLRLYYTVIQRDGRWYLSSDRDGSGAGRPSQVGLWDLGQISVVAGERSLVLGLASSSRIRPFAAAADAAVTRVTDVWGRDWPGKVIVEVPDTQQQMELLAGVEDGFYDQIAAITRRETGKPADDSAGDRVIINPELWTQLGTLGRRVVMTHEIAHVATHDATNSSTPIWLSEGFADYVAYRGLPVPVAVSAQDVLAGVRHGRLPKMLPTLSDFEPTNARLAEVYESAWLACRLLADRYGQDKLVRFYRAVGSGSLGAELSDAPLDPAFEAVFDLTTARFTSQWRSYLENLAG
ncbi:MAG TPA: hypothetical protein VKG85_04390 [Actinomycetes bacterium]|nr:hypothetical protein [Actinomycetes bacterium]